MSQSYITTDQLAQCPAIDRNLSAERHHQTDDVFDGRTLACSVQSDQSSQFTSFDLKIYIFYDGQLCIAARDILQ